MRRVTPSVPAALSRLIVRGLATLALLGSASAFAEDAAAAPRRPNIVYIMSDDLGWGSVGCYGADSTLVRTPNIDRLAREGRRFTDAYVTASICTPSRYAMLTGRYCWRGPLKFEVIGTKDPLLIEQGRPTVASMLKSAGYATGAIGKWHLGFGTTKPVDYTKDLRPGPLEAGFDYFHGIASNHGDGTGVYLDTEETAPGPKTVRVAGLRSTTLAPFGKTAYGGQFMGLDAPQRVDEDVMSELTDKAVAWIGEQQRANHPFFLYFAPVAVHGPITPSAASKGSSQAGPYGDFIHDLDRSVGALLDALERLGLAKDTLVIFTSDNGGENRGFAKIELEAVAKGLKLNAGLRAGKHSIYEGGTRVPFIARWPGQVPAGTVSAEPLSLVDSFATFAALTGTPMPAPDQGAEDSFNLLPAFLGKPAAGPLRPYVIGHSGWGVFSIRQGPWKWIEGKYATAKEPKSSKDEFRPQLYNLEQDPGETRDLSAEHPDIAARLAAELERLRALGHSRS